MNLINFSHPLSDEAKSQICEQYADGTQLHFYEVKVQIDLREDPLTQILNILDGALNAPTIRGNPQNVDVVILPGLSIVAAVIVLEFQASGYVPNILTLVRDGDSLPPKFLPKHLIRGGRWGGRSVSVACPGCTACAPDGPEHLVDCSQYIPF